LSCQGCQNERVGRQGGILVGRKMQCKTHVNITRINAGLPPSGWAYLVGVSGGENVYLGSSILIINYPALSAAIGGWDGVDCSRAYWMTLPFWEAFQMRQILMDLVDF
jgi:hypothetical protein